MSGAREGVNSSRGSRRLATNFKVRGGRGAFKGCQSRAVETVQESSLENSSLLPGCMTDIVDEKKTVILLS